MALLLISLVIVPASDKLSRKRAFTKRLGLQSMFHMVIQKTIYGGECASARVNEWVSEYVIRWPICFSAVWNVLTDLVRSGTVWFGLDRRLLSQVKSLYQSESHFSFS